MLTLLACVASAAMFAQSGSTPLQSFQEWRKAQANQSLGWNEAISQYRAKLKAGGMNGETLERTIDLITAYDEAELYDRVYSEAPRFNTNPNQFLVDAIEGLAPGAALDAGMGQGRNSIYLARKGWKVTGFDVSANGLAKADEQAAAAKVAIKSVQKSDVEFDFGRERWDLIVIIHAMEKRSVLRAREALKPGGHVVVEASYKESGPGGYPYGYESNELLKAFEGFKILRYEERLAVHDFSDDRSKRERLVRLLAQRVR